MYNATHPAGHAFLITGFQEKTAGGSKRLVFKTRNSWGGINPEIEARELWRMNSAAVIDAPKSTAPAGLTELAKD